VLDLLGLEKRGGIVYKNQTPEHVYFDFVRILTFIFAFREKRLFKKYKGGSSES
jgi:hypothetical protein